MEQFSKTMSGSRWVRAAVLIVIGLVAAWSWLFVVFKWGPATRIDILTFKSGVASNVTRALLRAGSGGSYICGPGTSLFGEDRSAPNLSGLYATPEYFSMTEQTQDAAAYRPDRFAVFFVFEEVHMGVLPSSSEFTLRTAEGRQFSSFDARPIRDSEHHRATLVRFPKWDAEGRQVIADNARSFELVAFDPVSQAEQTMRWDLPIVYPNEAGSQTTRDVSLATLFGLLAGMLAVLSPCLLQLTIYYTFAIAGVSMQQRAEDVVKARGRVIRTALSFMAGFTIVFTVAGALAGLAGETLQTSGILERLNRPLMIAAGAGILLLGISMAVGTSAPGLCRLPRFVALSSERNWINTLKTMFLGSAFAIGCSTCFGGALFISLMIYVGATGSASLGALALFLFSLGIGIPYLLSAFFLSRALPLLGTLQRTVSGVGFVSSAALIFFGVILITDNFHIPSSVLYRLYLGI